MKREVTERALAGLLLGLVGTVGVLGGIVLDRTLLAPTVGPDTAAARAEPAADLRERPGLRDAAERWRAGGQVGERILGWLDGQVDLTGDQERAIRAILDRRREEIRGLTEEVRPRYRAIVRETRREVVEVLTPEQRREVRRLLRGR